MKKLSGTKGFCLFLVLAILAEISAGCGGGNGGGGGGFFSSTNLVFFVSNRTSPRNNGSDGDIFSVDVTGGTITNLTDSNLTVGDSSDIACAVDLNSARNRLFFVSQRTDIGNAAGDVDIFMVPTLGGTISNITDGTSGSSGTTDKDDACLGLIAATGDVVFESNRTDATNVGGDLDIFIASLTTNSFGGISSVTISNRTEESAGNAASDRLVWIGTNNLYFESTRPGNDGSAFSLPNNDGDQHIFSVNTAGVAKVINLTSDGDVAGVNFSGTTVSQDVFCGISSDEQRLVFQSTRNQGIYTNGSQMGADRDIFVRDIGKSSVVTVTNGIGVNSAIVNLTDGGTRSGAITPEDDNDVCRFGLGWNSVVTAGSKTVSLFVSSRTASGNHSSVASVNGGFSVFNEFTNHPFTQDTADIFTTTFEENTLTNVSNVIKNLTDSGSTGFSTGYDRTDTLVGICGNNVIFQSAGTGLASTSNGVEEDIYSVATTGGTIFNLSDGRTASAGDNNDVFLCCNSANNRVAFLSARTDVGNIGSDVDIFSVGTGFFPGSPVNMTDSGSGDAPDGASAITGPISAANAGSGAGGFPNATLLTSGVTKVPSGTFSGTYNVAAYSDFPVACTSNDYIVFISNRTDPNNTGGDLDVFSIPFFAPTGGVATRANILNLSNSLGDTGSSSTTGGDANDGLTAVQSRVKPLF